MPLTINKRLQEGDFFETRFDSGSCVFYVIRTNGNEITAGNFDWLRTGPIRFHYDKTKGLMWRVTPTSLRVYKPYTFIGRGRKTWWRRLLRFLDITGAVHPYSPPQTV
jgi:hypothetical protein